MLAIRARTGEQADLNRIVAGRDRQELLDVGLQQLHFADEAAAFVISQCELGTELEGARSTLVDPASQDGRPGGCEQGSRRDEPGQKRAGHRGQDV